MIHRGAGFGEAEEAWIARMGNRDAARCCVRYARLLNTLDASGIEEWIAPSVTYDSQAVFETLSGGDVVAAHLAGKVEAIAARGAQVAAELGDVHGEPCVIMFQQAGGEHANWLDRGLALMLIRADDAGRADAFNVCTIAPHPHSARRSGIWPGRDARPEVPRRRACAPSEVTAVVCYLGQGIARDRRMRESLAVAREAFPALGVQELEWSRRAELELPHGLSFAGFPSVALVVGNRPVFTHEGLISGDRLVDAIRQVTGESS